MSKVKIIEIVLSAFAALIASAMSLVKFIKCIDKLDTETV